MLNGFSDPDLPATLIAEFEHYTGISSDDADFTEAAATVGAQTGLSTFVSLASFVLILFLMPPHRFFASWTRPTDDRRPAVLVVVLVAVFAAVLFVPALSDYFGLTGPAKPRVHHRAPAARGVVRRAHRGLPVPAARPDARARRPAAGESAGPLTRNPTRRRRRVRR